MSTRAIEILEDLIKATENVYKRDLSNEYLRGLIEGYHMSITAVKRADREIAEKEEGQLGLAESSTYEPDGAVCTGPGCECEEIPPTTPLLDTVVAQAPVSTGVVMDYAADECWEDYCCSGCEACCPESV